MSVELRRKLGHGAKLNIKVLLRGDTQTGKSSMLRRLQGLPHARQLEASAKLNVGSIDWNCEGSPDVVKVEVWDVVDADLSRRPANTPTLTLKHQRSNSGGDGGSSAGPTIDVWRGADAIVVLFDPRKRWTFVYALRLLSEAPAAVPVLLASNFADVEGGRNEGSAYESIGGGGGASTQPVAWSEVEQAAEEEAKRSGRTVVAVKTSMVDCTGLPTLHAFLQVPYYRAKQAALEVAMREAAEKHGHAEAVVRAMAAGTTPPPPPQSAVAGAHASAAQPHLSTPHFAPPSAHAAPPEEGPSTPNGGFGGFAPLSNERTPRGASSSAATPSAQYSAPPKLVPPPASTPPPPQGLKATSATPASGAAALPGLDAEIDDSFFDGEELASACEGVAVSAPMPVPAMQQQQSQEDDGDREEDDLLPLLDDPED